jgi:hypothetical protein
MTESIETLLHDEIRFPAPAELVRGSLVGDYETHYRRSLADLEGYWDEVARGFRWTAPWSRVLD